MHTGWTCLFQFLEDDVEAGEIVLGPEGIVEGQRKRDNGHGGYGVGLAQ